MIAVMAAFASAALGAAGVGALLLARSPRPARSRSSTLLRLLAAIGRPLGHAGAPSDLPARIAAAGAPGGLGTRELMAAKLAAAALAALVGTPGSALLPGRLGFVALAAAPVAGFLAPDLWLARRARERARRVRRDLPAMLDLLRVTIEAGSSLAAALAAVGEKAAGPLAAEWRSVGRQVALGLPLARALDEMTRRLPQPEIGALAAAIDRAARHGAPLGATLAAQAADARAALRRALQEDAARAGPKIQLVVALLLVPSVLLLVAAALVAALVDGGAGTTLPGA